MQKNMVILLNIDGCECYSVRLEGCNVDNILSAYHWHDARN